MFRTYLKTAWRNLSKHKSYSLINIFGLTLGIASCLVIYLVVKYELNYDRFNTKADRIYRVTLNAIDFNPCVSMAIAPAMRNDFKDLETVTQTWFRQSGEIKVADKKYQEKNFLFADQYFTSVFDYQWIQGDPKTALNEPNSLVLTESFARKYFGKLNAVGQLVTLQNQYPLKVTGLIRDLPGNTHLPFNFLVSLTTIKSDVDNMAKYFWGIPGGSFTYIVTPVGVPIAKFQQRIHGFIEKNWGADNAKDTRLPLQPLTDIHFDQRYLNNTISYTTSKETYFALSAVAVLIIVIACINFINLATAQAMRRAREVGVRKVLGSSRSQLIGQFLGETALMTISALILGLIIVSLSLPQLAAWLDIKISIAALAKPGVILGILGALTLVILLAGLYPAFVQSAFKPIETLKSKATLHFSGLTLRKSLVVVQFAISQIMIVGTLVVAYQMDFFQNRNLGFVKDAVISVDMPDEKKDDVFRQQLANMPGVKTFCFSSGAPVISSNFTSFTSPELGITKDDVTELKFVDEDYMKMFGLQMLAGDKISKANINTNDSTYSGVVNEAMIEKLGIQDPQKAIGRHVFLNGNWKTTITGVMRNFQSESKHKKIRPCALLYRPDNFYMASIIIQPESAHNTIAAIEKAWSAMFPENTFSYEFLDDHIARWYRQEQKEYTAFKLFSGVAILIGCLGLYGLVAFAAAQRTKEVGIRKVLGASISDIVVLFSKEFVVLIVIAFLIAAPTAYYLMHNWLQGFAYQIHIGAQIFLLAIASSFIIAAATIGYQALRAGVADPVESLRSE